MKASPKKYVTAVCLSGIFGLLGIHHFYLGRWIHGFVDFSMTIGSIILIAAGLDLLGIILLCIDVIHTFVVSILLLVGAYKDGNGDVVTYPGQNLK
jgi:TM2 domain-containing membrane protein YozV